MIDKKAYKYFRFIPKTRIDGTHFNKTGIYECVADRNNARLGEVKWYAPWRQYCFFPNDFTVFSKGCMEDINNFIDLVTKNYKESKK
jgi:hypothetical protein